MKIRISEKFSTGCTHHTPKADFLDTAADFVQKGLQTGKTGDFQGVFVEKRGLVVL